MNDQREQIEKKILGSLMLGDDVVHIKSKMSLLKPEYFKNNIFKTLFNDIREMNAHGLIVDANSVLLTYQNKYNEPTLIDIITNAETFGMFESHVLHLKDLWAKNSIDELACKLRIDTQRSVDIYETINNHNHEINEIKKEIERVQYISQREIRDLTRDEFEREPDMFMRVPYCMPLVNEKIEMFRGQIHVIGGESGIGKTALCLSFIRHQYLNGINSVYFCCESKAQELLIRLACQISTTSFSNAVRGFKYGNRDGFLNALDHYSLYPDRLQLFGRDNYKHTVEDIDHMLFKIQNKTRLDMVYIDYFQTLRTDAKQSKFKKQFEVYEDIIDAIAGLAVKYNCCITLLSQLNRDRTDDDHPSLINLRGASAIENVAHIISFIYMEQAQKKDTDLRVKPVALYSGKTRLIAPYNIRLDYDSYCGLYHDELEPIPFPWDRKY